MRVLIIGAGGQGRVVADAMLQAWRQDSSARPMGFLDDNVALHGRTYLGLEVLGAPDLIATLPHDAVIVAIGDNATRHRVAAALEARGERLASARHPAAIVAPDAVIDAGAMISAGAAITTGVRVGAGCIVNTASVIDHDSMVGDWAHIAPRAVLGGDVTVGAFALVGIGACVLPGRRIGERAIVGAGAVVTTDVPDGATVVGVPARVIRRHA